MNLADFLASKNLIQKDDVGRAVKAQTETRELIGNLAVEMGFMTTFDRLNILREGAERARSGKEKKHYGEIAQSLGLLTEEQIHRLLHFQRETTEPLGKVLLEGKYISRKKLVVALNEFSKLKARGG